MAVEYIVAVYELPDLNTTEVAILAYLANRANSRGECWPSRATIAEKVRCHPDTVKVAMQGLANVERPGGALIGKEARYSEGRQIPSRIVLLFAPADITPATRGNSPPHPGGNSPPTSGGAGTPGVGGSSTPRKKHQEEPTSKAREGTEGAARVWALASKAGRRKSGMADVQKALGAALGRGGALPDIEVAVKAYYAVPRHMEEDGRWAMGLHRLLEQDRWKEWAPDLTDRAEGDAAQAPPAAPSPRQLDEVWRYRLGEFTGPGHWDERRWGPRPGEAGCRVPAHLLAELADSGVRSA